MRYRSLCWMALVLLLACAGEARGRVALSVDIGWQGMYRAGRWTPIYLTLADDQALPARNVRLELIAPLGSSGMRIVQQFAIRPEPRTIILYAPIGHDLDSTILIVRDGRTGRKLAERALSPDLNAPGARGVWYSADSSRHLLFGVTGRGPALATLTGTFYWDEQKQRDSTGSYDAAARTIKTGYLDPRIAPDAMQGYDGLDLLVLNAPSLAAMGLPQQQAIADWVRGGGRLLFWPGEGLIPPDSPIATILPCRIGDSQVIALGVEDTKRLGIPSRIETFGGRELQPLPSARTVPILAEKAVACFGRAGLGAVAALSVDAAQLPFSQQEDARRFWRPVLRELMQPEERQSDERYGWYGMSLEDRRRLTATEQILDQLGNVPGVGSFDFAYIAIVLIAMMFIVGPIDWFILRKLGRQPWTWATTMGWIALVTLGGLYIGEVVRSGDLHYRTVRLIDQADQRIVGTVDLAAIYSPRTEAYDLDVPDDGWWRPAAVDPNWYGNQRITTQMLAVQDLRGTRPLEMLINVWNLRFMRGDGGDPAQQPPMIEAALRLERKAEGQRIVGTITNLGPAPLRNVRIRTNSGVAAVTRLRMLADLPSAAAERYAGEAPVRPAAPVQAAESQIHSPTLEMIGPNETISIDLPLDPHDGSFAPPDDSRMQYGRWSYPRPISGTPELAFMLAAGDLAAERSERLDRLLAARDDLACIYAESADLDPAVKMRDAGGLKPLEKHWLVIRALVQLE